MTNLRIFQMIREIIEKSPILKLLLLDCITKSLICALTGHMGYITTYIDKGHVSLLMFAGLPNPPLILTMV